MKCEKWNKQATVACLACGLGEDFYYWYAWDNKLHQANYKKVQKRRLLKYSKKEYKTLSKKIFYLIFLKHTKLTNQPLYRQSHKANSDL